MHIYLIQELGEARCWQEATMMLAINAAKNEYMKSRQDEYGGEGFDLNEESDYYEKEILQSCTFVGELANPVHDGHSPK